MNTAIHDAYDLGWKLGWVLRGWTAGSELLESYEAERRPVGVRNTRRSAQRDDGAAQQSRNGWPRTSAGGSRTRG
jgi:putative polyketide hydroxylase